MEQDAKSGNDNIVDAEALKKAEEIESTILVKDAAVTKSGQMSLPRDVADALGVEYGKSRVRLVVKKDGTVMIKPVKNVMERFRELRKRFTPEQKRLIRKNMGKTVAELRRQWDNSPEGKAYYKERYGA
ncbi:AbrB/MazE/SpoVT family DNA-binding domain-containing protein [Candidatus Saccharibacteria bacterium]|nr:AbrB/MazE/SpoVT family DNA-binding domain-containing protein [Candidatus Saccharibacteria bacterium]